VKANGQPRRQKAETIASVLRSLAHPTRVRALFEYRSGELSPTQLADRLGDPAVPLPTLAYHVRHLADAGLIRLTGATPSRGAMEHHYSLTPLGQAAVAALDAIAPSIEEAGPTQRSQGRRLEL
jgi:DNA-binding transcriptional ArsR family regulator